MERFLAALYEVKSEIEERLPDYFDYHALRCRAPAGAERLAIPFAELCEHIATAYDVSLLAVTDAAELNAVDELFDRRVTGISGDGVPLADPGALGAWLAARRAAQDEDRRLRDARVARMPASLPVHDAGALRYYAAGSGVEPIVLLNALDQDLHYWFRLVDLLSRRRRVLAWETPEATAGTGLRGQVAALEAVLEHDGSARCHVVSWCTGAKAAIEFYRRHPGRVATLTFLNPAFKWTGGPPELDSPYERNLEPVCRAIDRRPGLADSLIGLLRDGSPADGAGAPDHADGRAAAAAAVATPNATLARHVTAPFRSAERAVGYARQSLDFWAYDATPVAATVGVAALFVTAEHDAVATPAMARSMARVVPGARLVEVPGATHYCLYDRPGLIAELIEQFTGSGDLTPFAGRADVRVAAAGDG